MSAEYASSSFSRFCFLYCQPSTHGGQYGNCSACAHPPVVSKVHFARQAAQQRKAAPERVLS